MAAKNNPIPDPMTSISFPYDRNDDERELGLFPPDGRWEFPQSITFRPGAGQIADVTAFNLSRIEAGPLDET